MNPAEMLVFFFVLIVFDSNGLDFLGATNSNATRFKKAQISNTLYHWLNIKRSKNYVV